MKRFFGKKLGAIFSSPKTVCCSFTKWLLTKIQSVITSLSADKFCWQPALSAKPGIGLFMYIGVDHLTFEGEGRLFLKKIYPASILVPDKNLCTRALPNKNLHTHSVSQKSMLHEAKTLMHAQFLRKKISLCITARKCNKMLIRTCIESPTQVTRQSQNGLPLKKRQKGFFL